MRHPIIIALIFALAMLQQAMAWRPSSERVPPAPQEFRAVWIATVHNLDWPSASGLSAATQQQQLISILNTCAQLRINAILLQVRPNGDAVYASSIEPWSQWLRGAGANPGYDPLAFAIAQAHARGIEVHAWFNPFRAKANISHAVGSGHLSLTAPNAMRRSGSTLLADPGASASRTRAMQVIIDVTRRYDIDGVHLDDYFYPYPQVGVPWNPHAFGDGRTPAQRRSIIDSFVKDLYNNVKSIKPHVRVGISPFGIWRPGVPATIQAGVDAYEHLACDARKWFANGWLDYVAPQLYWRCEPAAQSFPVLMQWWAAQNTSRPVFPGIASARIKSTEDPGRTAAEIARQIQFSRSLTRQAPGQIFWSARSIVSDRGGIQAHLRKLYPTVAVPPAMPWSGRATPNAPMLTAQEVQGGVSLQWQPRDKNARKWVVQARTAQGWSTLCLLPSSKCSVTIPHGMANNPQSFSVHGICPFGSQGPTATVTK